MKEYRESNRNAIRESQKQYYEQNKDVMKFCVRKHYEQNKDAKKLSVKQYYDWVNGNSYVGSTTVLPDIMRQIPSSCHFLG